MRIAVISDTHGEVDSVVKSIKELGDVEFIIHLGDMTVDGEEIRAKTGIDGVSVKGNCDHTFSHMVPESLFMYINGHKIYALHGDRHRLNHGKRHLLFQAEQIGAQIILYGHTHVFSDETIDGIRLINPGSASSPRHPDRTRSFAVLDLSDEVKVLRIPV